MPRMSRKPKQLADNRSFSMRLITLAVTVLVVAYLMRGLVRLGFLSDNGGWQDSEFDAAASRFQSHVVLARTEWLRTGRAAPEVTLTLADDRAITVPMNAHGWPAIQPESERGCLEIWQRLAEAGELRRRLTAELLEDNGQVFCRFTYHGETRFDYAARSGQVRHHPRSR